MVDALAHRGAPLSFLSIARGAELVCHFQIDHSSKSTTLYLPDRTRVSMDFDEGMILVEDKRQPTYFLFFELLFGDESLLLNYCEQVQAQFRLSPVQLSRQQMALRILRSR